MWGAGKYHELVFHARVCQGATKLVDGCFRDALIRAAKEPKHRRAELASLRKLDGRRRARATRTTRPAVKADHAGEIEIRLRAGKERQPSAKAEADGED